MSYRVSPITVALGALVLGYLILPNFITVPLSFNRTEFYSFPPTGFSLRWYQRFFEDSRWTDALLRSARIGVATAVLASILGICAGFALARAQLRATGLITALIMAPLVVPHVILAGGLFVLYVDLGILTKEIGLVLAHTLIAFPIVTVTVMVALRSLDPNLELAAMSLGAGHARTFISVTLPQIAPGLVTGAIFAFVSSFDEITMAVFLGGVRSTTLPMKMWEGITVESNPVLPAASTILLIGSTIPLIAVEMHRRWRERRRAALTGREP